MKEPGLTMMIPVRWGDMDALGHVNNTVYFRYCESSRIAYFEALGPGVSTPDGAEGVLLAAANLNFRRPMIYPGVVSVTIRTTALGRSSVTMSHVLRDLSDGGIVADGGSVCVWADFRQGKSLPLPESLVDAIVELEANPGLRRPAARSEPRTADRQGPAPEGTAQTRPEGPGEAPAASPEGDPAADGDGR